MKMYLVNSLFILPDGTHITATRIVNAEHGEVQAGAILQSQMEDKLGEFAEWQSNLVTPIHSPYGNYAY